MSSTVPSMGEIDRWVEVAAKCEYLPENDLKVSVEGGGRALNRTVCVVRSRAVTVHLLNSDTDNRPLYHAWYILLCYVSALQKLCDYVCDLLLEESNVQPVSTPITVCGDIHGQVRRTEGMVWFVHVYTVCTLRE